MNPQYEILAKCLLPAHMLEWFELTNIEVRPKEKKTNQEQQSEENSPNVIKTAYSLTHSLRMIFAQRCDRDAGRESIKKWYLKVGEFDNKAFNVFIFRLVKIFG